MPPAADPRGPVPAPEEPGAASVQRLTRAIARGDSAAFGDFYEVWFDRAFSMARSVSRRDESFCLDIVQDTMLRAVKSMKPLPSERALTGWMARVVLTVTIDRLRKERRRPERELQARHRVLARGEEWTADDEQISWLEGQLEALSARDRRLIRERFHHGKTLSAAGEAVGLSGHAAHGRIRRTIERLRRAAKEVFP